MDNPFSVGHWIWTQEDRRNQYCLFAKRMMLSTQEATIKVKITASYAYELYINGTFVGRGPVPGDPQWIQYDEYTYEKKDDGYVIDVAIIAHHSRDTHLHSQIDAPGGVLAEFDTGGYVNGTNDTWKYQILEMWRDNVPERGWALGYCEDYDARLEPENWTEKRFPLWITRDWPTAKDVENADETWGGYTLRMTPQPQRGMSEPLYVRAWRASLDGVEAIDPQGQEIIENRIQVPIAVKDPWQVNRIGNLSHSRHEELPEHLRGEEWTSLEGQIVTAQDKIKTQILKSV